MNKIIFIVIRLNLNDKINEQKLVSSPELDVLIKEGWKITNTENITPPHASLRSVIQVNLFKEKA